MTGDELHWRSATSLAAGIKEREVSSEEVLDHLVARIERLDGPVNSVVHWDLDRARIGARAADAATVAGDDLGPLHGVPMTIKDSFQTEGCITTSGAPELADFVPPADAAPVARLRAAGAIPFAKTNLPIYAGDLQSYSGVMGHKPTYGVVPAHGQIPGPPGTLSQADLAVAGPMARTVDDLELGLDVMSGPDRWDAPAWRLDLPPSRAATLGDLRLAAWMDDDYCPVDADTSRVLGDLVASIDTAGGRLDDRARPGFTLERAFSVFGNLLFAALSGGHPREKLDHMAGDTRDTQLAWVRRATAARHRDWLSDHERRLQMCAAWETFFDDFDAILLPVHPRPAIRHDHTEPMFERRVDIDGVDRSYVDLFPWIAPAGLAYLPATVVPVGRSTSGLPIGVQIVGPRLQDRTTLQVARHIAEITRGCPRPALAT